MCGLFGFITKTPNADNVRILRGLGMYMQDRGDESTGVATFDTDEPKITKRAVSASLFMDGFNEGEKSWCALGHTRLATQGAVNDRNAHPFQYGKIVGCHNGILLNDYSIGKFEVDSEAIFYNISKYGGDYVKALSELRGSMALSWCDGEKLYLMRHENPLCLVSTKDSMFWASEETPLITMMVIMGIEDYKLYEVPEDTVLEISKDIKFVNAVKVKFKEWEQYNRGVWKPYYSGYEEDYGFVPRNRTDSPVSEGSDYVSEYVRQVADEDGCAICGKKIKKGQRFFYDNRYMMCVHAKNRCFEKIATEERIALKLVEVKL